MKKIQPSPAQKLVKFSVRAYNQRLKLYYTRPIPNLFSLPKSQIQIAEIRTKIQATKYYELVCKRELFYHPKILGQSCRHQSTKGIISMPIKWVLHWQPNAGHTVNSQILAEVSQCVESINGVKEGKWKATLSFYRPVLKEQANAAEFPRDFLGISLPEQPDKYYFVLRGHRLVVEADSTIQNIMEKLQSYKTRVALNFEGFQYQLGDFQLRVGKVVSIQSESLRGIVMEMEYKPSSSWEKSHKIMGEFFDIWQEALSKRQLPGHFVHMEPNFGEYGLSGQYTLQHTAVQYATLMLQMIATAQSVRN